MADYEDLTGMVKDYDYQSLADAVGSNMWMAIRVGRICAAHLSPLEADSLLASLAEASHR